MKTKKVETKKIETEIDLSIDKICELLEAADIEKIKHEFGLVERTDLENEAFVIPKEFDTIRYNQVFEDLFKNIKYIPIEELEGFVSKHKVL